MRWPRATFAALRVRNYRLYFAGQAISLIGTWMQSVALSWLVLGLLMVSHVVVLWMAFVIAAPIGMVMTVDNRLVRRS